MDKHIDTLLTRFPILETQRQNILDAFDIFKTVFQNDGTLFICGNGGSAADAEHIVGELMKSFKLKRQLSDELRRKFIDEFDSDGAYIANKLQCGLRSIALTNHSALSTAYANDVDASLMFAQQLFVLSRPNDAFLAISTSGNSDNVVKALKVAKIKGLRTVALTGASGGNCKRYAECCIAVPETETFIVQEYHLPIYHCLCLMIEDYFYGDK